LNYWLRTMAASSIHSINRNVVPQFGVILAAMNFCIGLVWMAVIQPLDAPDEPGHLGAIMQVRKQHMLPEIHYDPGNPVGVTGPAGDPETRAYVVRLVPKLPVSEQYFSFPYEAFQPPLYYVVTGLVTQVVPPDPQTVLYAARLLAVLFGTATVYFCWLTTRELAPQAPLWAIASAGVVALLPSFCFDSAHASNDSIVNLTATAAFYVWIRGLRCPEFDRRLWGAGAMVGLALLSKLTAVALIPGLALVILFRMFQVRPSISGLSHWIKRSLNITIGATLGVVLVSGWWFVRNIFTYGEPIGTAAGLQFWAARFIKADFSRRRTAGDLLRYTLESLWGRFGWNDITLPQEVYRFCNISALFLISLSVLTGIGAVGVWATRKRLPVTACQTFLVFLAVGLALLAGYLQFNKQIAYMPMARYFFIMLLPGALLLTGGLYTLAARRVLRLAAFALLFIGLGSLNVLALVTVTKAGVAIGGVRQNLRSTWSPGA
jgi:4-amino-4-deoxy-L-arabinose transferase-like glycosyltransferase